MYVPPTEMEGGQNEPKQKQDAERTSARGADPVINNHNLLSLLPVVAMAVCLAITNVVQVASRRSHQATTEPDDNAHALALMATEPDSAHAQFPLVTEPNGNVQAQFLMLTEPDDNAYTQFLMVVTTIIRVHDDCNVLVLCLLFWILVSVMPIPGTVTLFGVCCVVPSYRNQALLACGGLLVDN